MNDKADDRHFSQALTLRKGTPVTIRVMRPDDKNRLEAAFAGLDPQSIYTRFFGFRKELPEGPLKRIATIDFVRLLGLVVTTGEGADEIIIGSATYVADTAPDGTREAEVAFTIEEDYQGQGLAGKLLAAMAAIARRHGITRLVAEVLAGNAAMLSVFQRSSLPMTRKRVEGGVIRVELELSPPPA